MSDQPKRRKRRGERSDGTIMVTATVGFGPDGKRQRKYFYGRTRAEAEAKRAAFLRETASRSSYPSSITVSAWVDVILDRYRGRVHDAYRDIDAVPYNRLKRDLGDVAVVNVLESDLQEALNKLEGMSFATVNNYLQAMRRVFLRAVTNRIIDHNPAEGLELPKYKRGSHRALARWEVDHILANWNADGVTSGLRIMLMLLCGLRRGEMVALDWSAVNIEARTLSVRQTAVLHGGTTLVEQRAKSDAGLRTLPICNALLSALETVPVDERVGFVCKGRDGGVLTEQAVRYGMDNFCRQMERVLNNSHPVWTGQRVDLWDDEELVAWEKRRRFRLTSHDLRHTFATALYDANVPVKAAQYFLGHADIRITLNLYTHLSREREAESRLMMVDYFNEWLRGSGAPHGDDGVILISD
jgi:integrase